MVDGLGIWALIGLLGAAQALAVGVALLSARGVRRRLYGLLLCSFGLAMGAITASHLPGGESSAILASIELVVSVWAPALFFVFVRLACDGSSRLAPLRGHFVVPALVTANSLLGLLPGLGSSLPQPDILWLVLFQVTYTVLATRRSFWLAPGVDCVPAERRLARGTIGLFWLIHGAQLVRFLTDGEPWRDIVPVTAAVVVFSATMLAARQIRVFDDEPSPPKYDGSGLDPEAAARALDRLQRALEVERVFLRHDLTLVQLAEHLGLPRNQLSQLINEHCGVPFTELLARHRVAEAERLLADPQCRHLTIDALAERAGFNARSAFYAAFKRATGLTPAQFRRQAASPPSPAASRPGSSPSVLPAPRP